MWKKWRRCRKMWRCERRVSMCKTIMIGKCVLWWIWRCDVKTTCRCCGDKKHRHVYTQTILETNPLHTNKHFYTQTLLHTDPFTHRPLYTQTLVHTGTFTHRAFYTENHLHTDAFYTQALLHTDPFTHRPFYTQTRSHTKTSSHLIRQGSL